MVGSVQSIGVYDRTATAVEQAGRIRDLVQAIGLERDTGGWIGASRSVRKALANPYAQRKASVDTLIKTVRADLNTMDDSYGPRVVKAVEQAKYDLGLPRSGPRVRSTPSGTTSSPTPCSSCTTSWP